MKFKQVRGFTLIELLIVIVIVGLLASLVAPEMFSKVDSSRIKTAKAQMEMLETSLNTYRLDMGNYPENLNELVRSENKNWDGPYLPKEVPVDPWGNPYVYSNKSDAGIGFSIMSYGRDGRPGGEGDDADIIHK
ncbi:MULTISPECIES: type II secretion system major pseudopilin GspG [Rheinheimera]|jgi:general secretion pathway protein G|uniref:Type II secretion system core protein G n=1 Tax=Rheinheimera aquimaris TaxID=412437 RepID=A0ABN1DAH6_9GAMM|nr:MULTISPECIES: type II secretion system major pseudopilin GspG [Rheinheimera]MCB5212561.1 type II secretion system major pseudopilin GspG [Rheinheimera aquimaris]MCD1599841.1 type II secretion system major pseudopilin GspG [Rheinheimera aquimaris]|tara:strand:+ start:1605 stop:2006 length:402 start_codon:yes stop_codon:yes gene_type:complete